MHLPPLSLYIHIPWCVRKCPYCDFNSHEQTQPLPINAYVTALLKDLEQDISLAQGRKIHSIFFGGGTPSLIPADAIQTILDGVKNLIDVEERAEITLETNPGTAEYSNFEALLEAGINRLSFGAQSFDDLQLATLGRIHSSQEISKAINKAKSAGFHNYNIDLMHGLPGQTIDSALNDIELAIALDPTHISWYQLTIEPNTAFYNDAPTLPSDDTQSDIYYEGLGLLAKEGFLQYEISAFAKSHCSSRHNLNYWEFGDYLAIGAGAHGKITYSNEEKYIRYQKTRMPNDYLDEEKTFTSKQYIVADKERPLEFLMNTLRLKSGVAKHLFEQRTALPLETIQSTISKLESKGLLNSREDYIQTSELGFRYLNEVLEHFAE